MFRFLRSRLNERSTWLLVGAAIPAAASLPWPWSLVSMLVATIAALVPDGSVKRDRPENLR